jgi:hypothetical protein
MRATGKRVESVGACQFSGSPQGGDVPLQVLKPDATQLSHPDRRDGAAPDQVEHVRPADAKAVSRLFHSEQETMPDSVLRHAPMTSTTEALGRDRGGLLGDHRALLR